MIICSSLLSHRVELKKMMDEPWAIKNVGGQCILALRKPPLVMWSFHPFTELYSVTLTSTAHIQIRRSYHGSGMQKLPSQNFE